MTITVNFHTMPVIDQRIDMNRIGWSSIPDYIIDKPVKYLSLKTKTTDFDFSILIEMIYDLCQSVDQSILIRLDKKYIKLNKIKIVSINIFKKYGKVTDIFCIVWEVPCVVEGEEKRYRKDCVFSYDTYNVYLRDKKINDIL